MKTINNSTLYAVERRKTRAAAKVVITPDPKQRFGATRQERSERRTAELLQQANDMKFSELARMLRDQLAPPRMTRKHALWLLELLDAKAAADEVFLRIAKNLRQDWNNLDSRVVAPPRREDVLYLPWILLPPGDGQEQLRQLVTRVRDFARRNPAIPIDERRIQFAYGLGPKQVYVGQERFDGYFVFSFKRTPRVLLENPIEGNAAYVFFQNWKYLSKLTKGELMARRDARRIPHSGEWKIALKEALGL